MLLVVLSVSPFTADIKTPSSVPDKMVRDWFNSTLYHVMVGLGLAIATQLNVAKPGSVTFTSLSVIKRLFGGTVRCIYRHVAVVMSISILTYLVLLAQIPCYLLQA